MRVKDNLMNVIYRPLGSEPEVIKVSGENDICKKLKCKTLQWDYLGDNICVFSSDSAEAEGKMINITYECDIGDSHEIKNVYGDVIIAGISEYFDDFTGLTTGEIERIKLLASND